MNAPKGYPHKQDFNIVGKKSTKKGWWLTGFRKAESARPK